MIADFANWNTYFAESREIVNVHRQLKEAMEKQERESPFHPDQKYLK